MRSLESDPDWEFDASFALAQTPHYKEQCEKTDFSFDVGFIVHVGGATGPDAPKIAGKWPFVLDMSHGKRSGTLNVQQDGEKLSGTGELEKHGASTITGSIQGAKVSMKLQLHGGSFTLLGTIEGDKMGGTTDPAGGTWKATRQTD